MTQRDLALEPEKEISPQKKRAQYIRIFERWKERELTWASILVFVPIVFGIVFSIFFPAADTVTTIIASTAVTLLAWGGGIGMAIGVRLHESYRELLGRYDTLAEHTKPIEILAHEVQALGHDRSESRQNMEAVAAIIQTIKSDEQENRQNIETINRFIQRVHTDVQEHNQAVERTINGLTKRLENYSQLYTCLEKIQDRHIIAMMRDISRGMLAIRDNEPLFFFFKNYLERTSLDYIKLVGNDPLTIWSLRREDIQRQYKNILKSLTSGYHYFVTTQLNFWEGEVLDNLHEFLRCNVEALEKGVSITRVFVIGEAYAGLTDAQKSILRHHLSLQEKHEEGLNTVVFGNEMYFREVFPHNVVLCVKPDGKATYFFRSVYGRLEDNESRFVGLDLVHDPGQTEETLMQLELLLGMEEYCKSIKDYMGMKGFQGAD